MRLVLPVAKTYGRNFFASVGVQLVLMIVSMLATDGGQAAQYVTYASMVYFVMAAWIRWRRLKKLTHGDLVAIRYGFVFVLFLGVVPIFNLVWMIPGISY